MAAKEKQQATKSAPAPPPAPVMAPPPTTDLLSGFDAPTTKDLPPPSYETNFLQDAPPPAFDAMAPPPPAAAPAMEFLPPPPMESVLPPPPPLNDVLPPPPMPQGDLLDMGMPSAPTATAPMFEDLHMQQPQEFHPPPLPPPMEAAPAPEPDIDASILNALEPAEREAFLEEQRKILAQIEREKSNIEASGAAARAMAFDQRSSNAAANVAAAYERGVPPNADFAALDAETAAQMASDAELAERLQKEEYAASEQRRSQRRARQAQASSASGNQSWYDWLTGAPAEAPATRTTSSSRSASRSGGSGGGGLVSAVADESVGLMSGSGGGSGSSGARVAAPNKSMFSCVADSMGTAVTQMYQFQADEEGNVHGVDSQGLLAMPDVSRQRENYD